MLTRRTTLSTALASAAAMMPVLVSAQEPRVAAAIASDDPPQLAGLADFGAAWSPDTEESAEIFAAEPDITTGVAELFSTIRFASYADLTAYFAKTVKTDYITWFNANLAGKSTWAERRIDGPGVEANFTNFWTEFLVQEQEPMTLLEFLAYMAIFTNECRGNLVSVNEGFNSKDHPGISYLFDTIVRPLPNGRVWSKRSYNTGAANRTAMTLFNDPLFNETHGRLALAHEVLNPSIDQAWASDVYPTPKFSSSGNPERTGYVLEADFFKFRGRGLIQTTWRSNYKGLVDFIKAYKGPSKLVRDYGSKWAGVQSDNVCTISSNADWDTLFGDSQHVIVCEAIRQHARAGKYLRLATTTTGINASLNQTGSIGCMGLRIGGGKAYAATFKGRVREMSDALLRA